jgi:hypothetical protein
MDEKFLQNERFMLVLFRYWNGVVMVLFKHPGATSDYLLAA